jgi:hypothetical protein
VFKRGGKFLIIAMLVLATGGHWFLLQSLAWVGMAVAYSQSDSIGVAIKKTFDGDHPCQLCRLVERGKKAEQQPQKAAQLKFDALLVTGMAPVLTPKPFPPIDFDFRSALSRAEPPGLPPPRGFHSPA